MIELNKITKVYKFNSEKLTVLNEFDLRIESGEFKVVMGPSGSGKSTLIHLIGGLLTPDSGNIIINNEKITGLTDLKLSEFRNKYVGFIFQNFNLQPYYNAIENIELPLIFAGVDEKIRREKALTLIEELGLTHRLKHRPSQMSGGEIQRVAIARALVNSPKIILADEPTGNLDSSNAEKIIQLLLEVNKKFNVTIVVVTHDDLFRKYSNNIINLVDGKICNDKK